MRLITAELRRRVRPYLPGTVLKLRKLWPGSRRHGYHRGQHFIVGPYCPGCGHRLIWLFCSDGTFDCTADRPWLRECFEIVLQGKGRSLYTFPEPWPPLWCTARVPPDKRTRPTAVKYQELALTGVSQ